MSVWCREHGETHACETCTRRDLEALLHVEDGHVQRLVRERQGETALLERAEARVAELERERDRLRAFRDAVMAWNKAMTVKALSQRYGRVSAEEQAATDQAWDAMKAAIAAEKEGT
jgi:hypothetical protein